jgi:uncharacterized membrane protein (DUF4010 family)
MDLDLWKALATALFIGALVGTERTHHQLERGEGFAGLRTFVIVAELGALAAWLGQKLASPLVVVAGLLGVSAFGIVSHLADRNRGETGGATTELAAVVVYMLGAVAVVADARVAVALGIVTAGLLAAKNALHQAVERISGVELLATLRLLFASFVVLPLLPRTPIDPWNALNPHKLWLLVVLISAISMVGYVAVRAFGAARGTLLTGFFGGLVSSTAVTLTFARQSREPDAPVGALASAVLLAWTVMFARVIALVGALAPALLPRTAIALGVMGVACVGSGLIAFFGRGGGSVSGGHELPMKNPFRLLSAIKFAALFAAVLLVSRWTQLYLPDVGLYWVSLVAGSTDVDAVALSLLELVDTDVSETVLVRGLILAAASNTLVKLALMGALGTRPLAWRLLPATFGILAAAVFAWQLV